MKFKQPKSYVPTLSLIGGTIAGAMLSRVGYSMLPETKENSPETLYRGAIAAVAGAGATFVDGNDALSNLVRGALIGASVEQGLSLVKQIAEDSKVESKLLKQAVGLACPCQERKLGNPYANLQRGRIIPRIQTGTPPINPYEDNRTANYNPPGTLEWEWEKIDEINKNIEKALSTQTTI